MKPAFTFQLNFCCVARSLLNKIPNVQVSDTTGDDSSTSVKYKK